MKLPNKFVPYNESAIANFAVILDLLKAKSYSIVELYNKLKVKNTSAFIDTLDCLFALNKIDFRDGGVYYVD